jgi:hypothetical protein
MSVVGDEVERRGRGRGGRSCRGGGGRGGGRTSASGVRLTDGY